MTKKSILIFENYKDFTLFTRLVLFLANFLFFKLLNYPESVFWIVNLIIVLNILFHVFVLKYLVHNLEFLGYAINSSFYISIVVIIIYFTGGLQSPLFMLLFFAPIGSAMSYGKKTAFYTVSFEFLTLFILSILYPEISIFLNNPTILITYSILLIMSAIFAGVVAKRYIDIHSQQNTTKKLTKQLEIKNKVLTETITHERDMLDILGHELRTPLSIARNAVSVLKNNTIVGSNTKEKSLTYLEMAEENLEREIKLLETILSSTKIDNNKINLNLEKVDLIDVIEDALIGLTPKAKSKGLKITFDHPQKSFIYSDRVRSQEVIDNLIDNAIKYTEKGFVKIEVDNGEKETKIKVSDTGIGISKDSIEKLGHKFYRVNNYLSKNTTIEMDVVRPGGTGLGLYVTFQLVKLMNGTIKIESEINKGSIFTITFPTFRNQEDSKAISNRPTDIFNKFKANINP